ARRPGLSVEVILTREEASRGGVLSIAVPVRAVCSECGGRGNDWLFPVPVLRRRRYHVYSPASTGPHPAIAQAGRGLRGHSRNACNQLEGSASRLERVIALNCAIVRSRVGAYIKLIGSTSIKSDVALHFSLSATRRRSFRISRNT